MAIAAEELAGAGAGSGDAALGRGVVEGQGHKVSDFPGLDLDAYGAHARSAIGGGRPVMPAGAFLEQSRPASSTPSSPRPAAPRAAARASSPSSPQQLGRAIGTTLRVPGAASVGPVQRLIAAVAVGLVVLEIGSLLTGQNFHLQFPGNPLAPVKAPPQYIGPSQLTVH